MAVKQLAAPTATRPARSSAPPVGQRERHVAPGRPVTPATLLTIQRTAGNRAAQGLVAVQRQQEAVGRGGGAYVKHDIDIPADDFSKLKAFTKAWPVELTRGRVHLEGYWSSGTTGSEANARGFGQFGTARNAGVRAELGKAIAESPIASLTTKGTWELTGGKTELSGTVAGSFAGLTAEGKLILARLRWDDRTLASNNGMPIADILHGSVAGKVARNFSFTDDGGIQHKFVGQLGLSLEFDPNWTMIGRYILVAIGDMAPVIIPLAAVAGLAAIVWAGTVDVEHRQQIAWVTQSMARQIIRAGDAYAGRMTDRIPGGAGGAATDRALARADADLGGIYSRFGLDRGQYLGALDLAARRQILFHRLSSDYSMNAISTFAGRMRERVEAWHREHWMITFLSGRYTADDMALVETIIATELANHGQPTIGG